MRTRDIVIAKPVCRLSAGWLLPMLVTLLVFSGGCASLRSVFEEKKQVAEITVENPPAYGVITHVTSADMADKENRLGDIILTIDLDDGQTVMVIQSQDNVYVPGDSVRVLRDGKGFVRVQLL